MEEEKIEEAKKGNEVLRIYQDNLIDINPREDPEACLGTLAIKHKNYSFGEEKIEDPIEWLEEKLEKENQEEYNNDRLADLEAEFFKKFIALKVYMLDHSGLRFSTSGFSCPWDSGQIGYIYTTKEKVKKEGLTKDRAKEVLEAEIETLDKIETGEVFRFVLVKQRPLKKHIKKVYEDGETKNEEYNTIEEEEQDSCCGFIGEESINQIYDEVGFNREEHKIQE